jgi:hypothetical protein
MDFKQYLNEATKIKVAKEKDEEPTAVMAFGRFNPPTIGHEKLIQKTEDVASQHSGTAHIIASHSEGTAKNPVPQQAKLGYLHNIVKPSTELSGSSKEEPTILHAAARLHKQGNKHLVVVAGSDRVNDYQNLLDQYNDGKKYPHGSYKFKSIKVLSAGQRDPDAEGMAGMSGTKIREYARAGNTAKFRAALPDALKAHANEIMGHIKAVPLKEDADPIREAYVNNQIYKLDDVVEATNGDKGPIVFRGSTYVTMQLAEGKTVKHWIKDIKESSKTTPEIIIKPTRKIMEKQVPALFLSKEKLDEMLGNETDSVQIKAPVKETITMSKLRRRLSENHSSSLPIGTASGTANHDPVDIARGLPDPKTAHRDVNLTPNKSIYHGIDKTIDDQGHPGKPPGLVSFKTFVSNPDVQAVELDKMEQEAEAQLAKAKLQVHTAAYNMMRKHKAMDHI